MKHLYILGKFIFFLFINNKPLHFKSDKYKCDITPFYQRNYDIKVGENTLLNLSNTRNFLDWLRIDFLIK